MALGGLAGARARVSPGRLPDLVIAGAQKGGTTFLYQELVRHPGVAPALTKEIHFFDDHWARGLDWYRGFFAADHGLTVEASPGYVFHPWALERLASAAPAARVVLLLRDPVARAHSHHQHEVRLGYESCLSFEEALAHEEDRLAGEWERLTRDPLARSYALRHHSYRARGEYLDQVLRAEALLAREQLLILRSEDLFRDPKAVLHAVQSFAGLEPWTPPEPGRNDMAANGRPMDPATRDRLAAHFAPHNAALAAHLDWPDLDWT